ncbi:MAG: peptide chain release factor 2 [Clostridiales bacterium]|nr:peptide chain release factor 2 [Clostridiales bacterium]
MIITDQIKGQLPALQVMLKEAGSPFDPAGLKSRLNTLEKAMSENGFWDNPDVAQKTMKEKKSIEDKLEELSGLEGQMEDLVLMVEMAEEGEDQELAAEAEEGCKSISIKLEELRLKTLLDGKYDDSNAIISVHAGSGGTDAQDWAEMLFRMYSRWCEKRGYKAKLIDMQDDTEGGIKSATLLVEGENAYGYLKNEKGVHRLVRISPFDSSGRRHTSFASLDVIPEIDDDVSIEINDDDLRIDTFRSSGAGGQHVNKTDSAIRITHIPTNIVVTCQNERSQHQNKETAMKLLMSKLIELKEQEQKESLEELKGDYSQITWGSQIRSYVFHPYTMVKDHRTGAEVGNVNAVMDGNIDYFINEKLKQKEQV